MLQTVDLGRTSLAAYRGLAPDGILDELDRLGRELRGLRVLHVNATPYGGGVSELLRSTVPLLNEVGLVAEWRIIGGDERLFRATKRIHNGLQGAPGGLSGLVAGRAPSPDRWAGRDPVCGMAIPDDQAALRASAAGRDFVFCSEYCQARFLAQPAHFVPSLAVAGATTP